MISSGLLEPTRLISIFLLVTSISMMSSVDNVLQKNAMAQSTNGSALISDTKTLNSDITGINTTSVSRSDTQLIVYASDLEEIRDNLAEAQDALSQGKLVELGEHINNIDRLVSIILLANSTLTINP